ncbi:YbfB/YjiJ family MFS transporter [Nocardia testacea]|uniref:YbfB/YjiJ family MFS transporter n=1 Tax=Nocardia testacea TaxID=248551 RepID=UPI0002D2A30B|nr:YbfB/YjiJ family MFS transporter [Nocardia testacea]
MTDLRAARRGGGPALRGRAVGIAAAAGLAAAMGVGRFVFTPLLPILTASAGMSAGEGAVIATGNYAGYLLGAVLLTRRPQLSLRSTFLAWSVVLVASEAGMAATAQVAVASGLRFLAGAASAAIFIACAATVAHHRHEGASPGVAFAGVGIGIAFSGVYTLLAAPHLSWQGLWLGSAVLTALLLAPAWLLEIRSESGPADSAGDTAFGTGHSSAGPARRAWRLLLGSYFAEGVGYIIIGTFLVAAVAGTGSASAGALVWTLVGLAAAPATLAWHHLAHRIGTGPALITALTVQAAGAAVAAASHSVAAAAVAAVAFGATFMGVVVLTLDYARGLDVPRAAATLTAVYAIGQVIGPLLVVPVIGHSFATAFTVAAVVIAISAVLAFAAFRAGRYPRAARRRIPAGR